ncbi:MAG: putative glycoside hydrolase [Acidimicrobiia bacterium]
MDTGDPPTTDTVSRRAWLLGGSVALVLAACSGSAVLVIGESVRPPEPPPPIFQIAVLAGDDLTPLPAALEIDAGTLESGTLDADQNGRATLTWLDEPIDVTASAPGFHDASATVAAFPDLEPVELRLSPVVLTGTVVGPSGIPLPGTKVRLGDLDTVTDDSGGFRMIRAVAGEISLERPAWEPVSLAWTVDETEVTVTMEPRTVRALRVQAAKTGDPEAWEALLELAETTEVNALVIDTKDEWGNVYHDTEVLLAHEIGAVQALYDIDSVVADMDERGLYKITRIVTFQDPWLTRAKPTIAAANAVSGGVWETYSGRGWLDPTDQDSWEYPLDLAEEACRRGFDEIQFDYVRFPSDGPISEIQYDRADLEYATYYEDEAQQIRVDTIAAFLSEAHSRLNPMGCAVAADIFAITLQSRGSDEGIGQLPGPLSSSVDVLSPMIYSYAYGPGWQGIENPNDEAPRIVQMALDAGIPQLEGFGIYRPWLQRAFLESTEILEVQGVAEDRGLGWMLWSENTSFDASMLESAG